MHRYQAPPGQVFDGHPWQGVHPHVVLSPQFEHPPQLLAAASAREGVDARPPAPTADMASATRPTKLRRVRRLPTRLVVFSNSWSNDMLIGLYRLIEWVFRSRNLCGRVGNQVLSLG